MAEIEVGLPDVVHWAFSFGLLINYASVYVSCHETCRGTILSFRNSEEDLFPKLFLCWALL